MVELRRVKDLVNRIAEEESVSRREKKILTLEFMQYIGTEKTLSQRVIREEATEIPCYDSRDEQFFKSKLILYGKRIGPKAPEPQPQENVYLAKKDKFSRVQGSEPAKNNILTLEEAAKFLASRHRRITPEHLKKIKCFELSNESIEQAIEGGFFKLVRPETLKGLKKKIYESLKEQYEVTINDRVGMPLYHFNKREYYEKITAKKA